MAQQRYHYDPPIWGEDPPPQRGGRSNHNRNNNDDSVSWLVIAILLVSFWPVGLYFLFRKLMGTYSADQNRGAYRYTYTPRSKGRYTYTAAPAPSAEKEAEAQQASPAAQQSAPANRRATHSALKPSAGRGFTIAGAIITWIFSMGLLSELADIAASGEFLSALPGLVALGGFVGLGAVLLYTGVFRRRRARLYLKYLALIGRREKVNLTALAKAAGRSRKKVCAELQDMLDQGVLTAGYLDLANDQLVLSAQGLDDQSAAPAPQREAPKENRDDDILRQIEEINDAIPDPVMSAKIERIREITGKILDYQHKNPGKASQLRSFLNYYLPTTLKILRSYAQLEQQGVEGENISAAKQRIEGMMDKVVEGFEKQLDRLFQDDAMDISTDVSVLEQMLAQDGLGHDRMTMGGT